MVLHYICTAVFRMFVRQQSSLLARFHFFCVSHDLAIENPTRQEKRTGKSSCNIMEMLEVVHKLCNAKMGYFLLHAWLAPLPSPALHNLWGAPCNCHLIVDWLSGATLPVQPTFPVHCLF